MDNYKFEDKSWLDLSPARQVEIVLHRHSQGCIDQVYILEAYLINHLGDIRDGFLGVIIKTYGMRMAATLNNSYEIVYANKRYKESGEHSRMHRKLIDRLNMLVKKKKKKGYVDSSLRLDLHIPALHKNSRRFGNSANSVPGTFVKNEIAHSNFEDSQVGSFVNIL